MMKRQGMHYGRPGTWNPGSHDGKHFPWNEEACQTCPCPSRRCTSSGSSQQSLEPHQSEAPSRCGRQRRHRWSCPNSQKKKRRNYWVCEALFTHGFSTTHKTSRITKAQRRPLGWSWCWRCWTASEAVYLPMNLRKRLQRRIFTSSSQEVTSTRAGLWHVRS